MSMLLTFVAALILAIAAVTFALARLAPSDALPPRGAVMTMRAARWLAKPQNAHATAVYGGLAAFACFAVWALVFYPEIAIASAMLVGVLTPIVYAAFDR